MSNKVIFNVDELFISVGMQDIIVCNLYLVYNCIIRVTKNNVKLFY